MLSLSLAGLAAACFVAVFNWRSSLIICVVVGLLQDPLRKLTPGTPVFFVGFAAATLAASCVGAMIAKVRVSPSAIYGWRRDLSVPALLFVGVLLFQAGLCFARYNNFIFPFIGAVFYVAPIIAVTFAHQLAVRIGSRGILKWMWVYVACSIPWFFGIYLEATGVRSPLLGEIGVGQIIYDVGAATKANAGFYRAAEIAAWHVATVSCFLFMVLNGRRLSILKTALVVIVVLFLLYVGLATGRRKMLVQIVIFLSVYFFLFSWFINGKAKLATFAGVLGVGAFVLMFSILGADGGSDLAPSAKAAANDSAQFAAWRARGLTVFGDIWERFTQLGYGPVFSAVWDFGIFGAGLGAGAQGAQHFGGGVKLVGGTSEGGLGKLALDLGLPGLLVLLWLLVVVGKLVWERLRVLALAAPRYASLAFGMVGLIVANVATFSVATQAYGDVFILMTLGTIVGILLALPTIAARELAVMAAPIVSAGGAMPPTSNGGFVMGENAPSNSPTNPSHSSRV